MSDGARTPSPARTVSKFSSRLTVVTVVLFASSAPCVGSTVKGACWRRLYERRVPGPRGSIDQERIAPIRGRREPAAISHLYTTCVKQL